MKPLSTKFLVTLPFFFSASCEKPAPVAESHAASAEAEAPTNRIDIPATVRANLGITFAKVERRPVATTLRVPGAFELEPLATREFHLLLPGTVQLAVKPLQKVQPGELLYRVRSTAWLELQSEIDLSRAALDKAMALHGSVNARLKALQDAGFDNAELEAERKNLAAEVGHHQAVFEAALAKAHRILKFHESALSGSGNPRDLLKSSNLDGTPRPLYQTIDWLSVHADREGIVDQLGVTDGAFAEEAALVLTLVDPAQVRFRATALQGDLPNFANQTEARLVLPQTGGGDANEAVTANLTIGLDADPKDRTITLFATPKESRAWIRPGVTGFLEIATDATKGPVLAIPRSAVVKDGLTHVFFKRDPMNANKAIREEADLGVDDGRWIEIKSGVGPKDEVVLDGAYELKLASSQSGVSQKGGHFHADGTYHAEED